MGIISAAINTRKQDGPYFFFCVQPINNKYCAEIKSYRDVHLIYSLPSKGILREVIYFLRDHSFPNRI